VTTGVSNLQLRCPRLANDLMYSLTDQHNVRSTNVSTAVVDTCHMSQTRGDYAAAALSPCC